MQVRIIGGHGGVSPGFKATSYLIDGKLLIDAGSVASGIIIPEQKAIEHILISHAHLDHISDLAFLADNCFGLKANPFEIYCHEDVRSTIMTHLFNDKIWPDFTKLPNKEKPTLRFHSMIPEKSYQLGDYNVTSVGVNHQGNAQGFLIEKEGKTLLFTQDTGPTQRIWEVAHTRKNLQAIFTEVSFPNQLTQVAIDSQHHTPETMRAEIEKMPKTVPIYLGHLKPNFQDLLYTEINALGNPRITIMGSDNTTYTF